MIRGLTRRIFGTSNERVLNAYSSQVQAINQLEVDFESLPDQKLRTFTQELRQRATNGEKLSVLLPEAFANVREAAKRTLGQRHYDVQLIGGMVLNEGHIAEMATGEGKTLVSTLPVYLNALIGKGVHVITVNDYLAKRDASWMGEIYKFLGMTVGCIVPGVADEERRAQYDCDITYGTNNEFGFDYLRDNMAFSLPDKMQGVLSFGIVDEVDSILIDEARTPLIISGPTDENSELYVKINKLIPKLTRQQEEDGPGDYSVDEKARQAHLTEEGHQSVEGLMEKAGLLEAGDSLYDASNIMLMHHVGAALRAHTLFQRDVEYIVRDGEIVIVDEFTGRTMPGRRWSEGLHQAVEAKEGVAIQNENQTLAAITFQNYFRLYDKLAGMTGTADTEATEFQQIYGLEVLVIPTHLPMIRNDAADTVYLTKEEKFESIIEDIRDCQKRSQPVLVGTTSIETSEYLSRLLTGDKIPHQVLNAKQHEQEAHVIAQAGRPGTVTIATNMAGRGTDIVLGGNLQAELEVLNGDNETAQNKITADWQARHDAVVKVGGLHIIGTERHESRRIDNQLRGRSGRQGDSGSSRFYLSLEDDLMRIFASERVSNLMQRIGMERGEAIEHPWVTKAIANAQRKVEGRNFDIRKQLLEYDDVANDQRKEIYSLRSELMADEDVADRIVSLREDVVREIIDSYIPPQSMDEQWDVTGLEETLERDFGVKCEISNWLEADDALHEETLRDRIDKEIADAYETKVQASGPELMRHVEKAIMLQVLDTIWKEHLAAMDYLRQSIGLRGYAQKNPKQEYKREAFEMFHALVDRFKHEVVTILSKVNVRAREDVEAVDHQRRRSQTMKFEHADAGTLSGEDQSGQQSDRVGAATGQSPYVRKNKKVGRNEPCPCGSGKKFKQCHGRIG